LLFNYGDIPARSLSACPRIRDGLACACRQLCADAARTADHAAGADEKFVRRVQPNTGHKVNPDSMVAAREWLVRWPKL